MQSTVELNQPHSPVSTITTSSFDKLSDAESLKFVESCSIPSSQWTSSKSSSADARGFTKKQKRPTKAPAPAAKTFPTTSKTNRRRKRVVSFETDAYGNVSTTVYLSETNTVEPHYIWWSKEEIMAMHAAVFSVCDFFIRFRQDYVQASVSLIAECTRSNANRIHLRRKADLHDVTNSSCRGLESTVVGIMVHQRQVRTVAQLLQQQERLRGVSADERAHLLALQYQRNTRYASLWAQILADGDAQILDDEDDRCIR